MAEKIVVWDDFSGGEFGDTPTHKVAPNQFTGLNVLVYRSGEIGPRPGIRELANSSDWAGEDLVGAGFMGSPANAHWIAFNDATTSDPKIRFRNLASNTWDASRDVTLVLGTADFVPQVLGVEIAPEEIIFLAPGSTFVHYDGNSGGIPSSTEITDITGTLTPGRAMSQYRDRFYVSVGNRVYFSNVGAFTTYTIASDFFDVGYGPEIRWMGWTEDVLLIITQDSKIWEYRGVPERDELRPAFRGGRHPWEFYPGRIHVTPQDQVVFVPVDRDYPALYRNGRIIELEHLTALGGTETNDPDDVQIVTLDEDDELMVYFNNRHPDDSSSFHRRFLQNKNGIWTQHRLEIIRNSDDIQIEPLPFISSDQQDLVYIHAIETQGGLGLNDTNIASTYSSTLERPAFTSDTYAQPGDGTDTPLEARFSTGEWWAPEGAEVTIKQVIVDFTKYDTGAGVQNHFDITLTQLARRESDSPGTVSLRAFDEDDDLASAAGIRDRHITGGPSGGAIPSAGFQLTFDNIVGCTIKSIRVVLDQNNETPRF